jgi:16S rRNA (adenine1518-N6/adenine1519-N6)-dimethyltransferase
MSRQQTRSLLQRQGLAPHKRLGQNFLVHAHTARRIVDLAGIGPEDRVIEVGVGLGALTRPLAEAAGRVVGIEADSGIVRLHREQGDLPGNVELVHADILKVDFARLVEPGQRLKIVANLPYSISTPFLFRLIEQAENMAYAVVMLQKEVAQRLTAESSSKEYGAPTVLLASCAEVRSLLAVAPEEFHPRPRVDSLVVRIQFWPQSERVRALGDFDRPLLRRVVHAAFGQRRKTLCNALDNASLFSDKKALLQSLAAAGIDPSVRAEHLELEDFVQLSRVIGLARQDASSLHASMSP